MTNRSGSLVSRVHRDHVVQRRFRRSEQVAPASAIRRLRPQEQPRQYFGPAEQPASTISPYDSISNAPINEINEIIDLTGSVPIRSAPLNEIIDLTEIDSLPRNYGLINRVNRYTRQPAVYAVGLESEEIDMRNIDCPTYNREHKQIGELDQYIEQGLRMYGSSWTKIKKNFQCFLEFTPGQIRSRARNIRDRLDREGLPLGIFYTLKGHVTGS